MPICKFEFQHLYNLSLALVFDHREMLKSKFVNQVYSTVHISTKGYLDVHHLVLKF